MTASHSERQGRPLKRAQKALRQRRVQMVPLARAVLGGVARVGRRRPRVSAVVVARNDGYFADYEARIRATITWNHARLADEVILVEWNPPAGAPLFATKLAPDYPFLKGYVVPESVHRRFAPPPTLVMLDYMAKNVGIRRATGDYICASNVDIFFDPCAAFIRFMLGPRFIMRTRRVDFRWDGQPASAAGLRRGADHLPGPPGWRTNRFHGCGDFTLAHRELWHRARGYDEANPLLRMHADSRGLVQLQACGGIIVLWGYHYHTFHTTSSTADAKPAGVDPAAFSTGIPYANPDDWGFGDAREEPLAERVWRVMPPNSA